MSISPEKQGIPREPTIQSCKHLNDLTRKLSTLSPAESPFKKSMSGMKVNRNTMKPFNSAINSGNGAFERSMRKLNVIKRNISSTVSQDQITQVDSNFSSGANEKSGDADFDQIDFTTA